MATREELDRDRVGEIKRARKIIARLYVDTEAVKDVRNQAWVEQAWMTLLCEISKGEHRSPSKLLVICEHEEVYRERLKNL